MSSSIVASQMLNGNSLIGVNMGILFKFLLKI